MTCTCITREDIGPTVPSAAMGEWIAQEFRRDCPEHGRAVNSCGHDGYDGACWQCRPSMFPRPSEINRDWWIYRQLRTTRRYKYPAEKLEELRIGMEAAWPLRPHLEWRKKLQEMRRRLEQMPVKTGLRRV